MKKLILSVLTIATLTATVSSCAKSSKRKLSNEWKIESTSTSIVNTQSDGDVYTEEVTASGTTYTEVNTTKPNGGSATSTTKSGTYNEGTFTISKDGTFKKVMDYTVITSAMGTTTAKKYTRNETGTWAFLGKAKEEDFKKNERVIFNTLSVARTTVTTTTVGNNPSTLTTSSNTETFATGDYPKIYTVTESKSKSLELTAEIKQTTADSGTPAPSIYTSTEKISLVEK